MKTLPRITIGILSSLFATMGLLRAAERMDPLTQLLKTTVAVASTDDRPAESCAAPCQYRSSVISEDRATDCQLG